MEDDRCPVCKVRGRHDPECEGVLPLPPLNKIVRYYDAFDGWINVTGPVSEVEARAQLNAFTKGGTHATERNKAALGEYYCIFPADTTMMIRPETLGR